MRCHRCITAGRAPPAGTTSSYYWNYFDLGLDVLISGETHTVEAVVLHTNCPGHAFFGLYRKANFCIDVPMAPPRAGIAPRPPPRRKRVSMPG